MKNRYLLFSFFSLTSLAVFGFVMHLNGQMESESVSEDVHPLVQGVHIIPGGDSVVEKVLTPTKTWTEILKSAGIEPAAEKCLECHFTEQTVEDAHPGKHLARHTPETFGCVLCHGGNGSATETPAAHTSTAGFSFLKGHQIEAACGKCHTEPAVLDAPYLSGGRFVLNKYGCVTCHNLPIEIPAERYAPRLEYIGSKVTRTWLDQWLSDPTVYLPKSKMPRIEMTESEREAIVEFLSSLRDDARLRSIEGVGNAENGVRLFVENECQTCHTLHGVGDAIGPALERVGAKVNQSWMMTYLKDPAVLHPKTKMPSYDFTNQQVLDLTEYLLSDVSEGGVVRGRPEELGEVDTSKANQGFKLYISKGCAQCHGIGKYMGVEITNQLIACDIEEAIQRIRAHQGERIEVPEIDIPDSDMELMAVAILALRRNEVYNALTYKLEEGTLGNASEFLEEFWKFPIPRQQTPPDYYNETISQLSPEACSTCHQQQWEDWKTTRHAIAMGPGIHGQLIGHGPGTALTCQKCHAPLSEQTEFLPPSSSSVSYQAGKVGDNGYISNKAYDGTLQSHGLVCAVCHVRSHQRFGPSFSERAASAQVFGEGHHGGAVVAAAYQDSAFCKPCHQFEENGFGLNGKLLENTYNEWLESPHATQGKTCQLCHMPDRRHRWRGIHDLETVRSALKLDVEIRNHHETIDAEIRLTNEGAGHHLPTYITPAIFVTVRLLDTTETPIRDTEEIRVIQRRVPLSLNKEVFDTRIPAGGTWAYSYQAIRPEHAKTLEIRLDVHPDHFYKGFFEVYKAANLDGQMKIDRALEITEDSPYLLMTRQINLKEE